MRRTHDMGGLSAGPVPQDEHVTEPWQKLVTAIRQALGNHNLMVVDELRRAIEDLDPKIYDSGYFERWTEAMINLGEEKGLFTRDELARRVERIRTRNEAAG